ncbi:Pls/PosA family non-ribosomal peptide synthetase [Streptomyces minutiscleroticus]|uniref:Pls/PosA family non-ribosomal peptide synthetase n=1 Tax=Streptomyces minutiscleroticus TaxID=68238 RepID=UPI003D9E173E
MTTYPRGADEVAEAGDVSTAELAGPAGAGAGYAGPLAGAEAEPVSDTERLLAQLLAEVVRTERVPADSHFFDDLGANSLTMAHFCARVRKRDDLPSVSMKDVYRHPTIRGLAAALDRPEPSRTRPPATIGPAEQPPPGSTARYVLCGVFQALVFLLYCALAGLVTARGFDWVSQGTGLLGLYRRAAVFGGGLFVGVCVFPIAAKWILVGRWKETEFPVWGAAYLRFWTVKVLVHANPMILFIGNPLYVWYLRALGARIGRNVTILTRTTPVCTDLLTIGDNTVIRKDAIIFCYRAHAGRIQTGPVTLGRDVFVGENTVLDIRTSMGDGAQLGHASALQCGEAVPAGQHWHGSPAQRTDVNHLRVEPARCGTLRRAGYAAATVLQLLLLGLPLTIGGAYMLVTEVPALGGLLAPGTTNLASAALYLDALVLSLVLFFGLGLVGLVVLFTVPRLVKLVIRPERVYPLYGFHYSLHRRAAGMTNNKFFRWLFGDSSYIVPYLSTLGYNLNKVEQTGSNFGTEVKHESPYLVSVGSGTMVADGLSIMNAEYSSTSFRVSQTSIGAHNFLGNHIAYPAGGRTGDDCLLATKVMVPLDGEVRTGVGLLGSPPFEVPRTVERDTRFDHYRTGDELRRRLAAKNRHNLATMGVFLVLRWAHVFALTVLGMAALDTYETAGPLVAAGYLALTLVFTVCYFVLIERVILRFKPLRPRLCSIYNPYFWRHERLWKVPDDYLNAFNGTPFKSLVWRMLGVRMGRRVFDDGSYMTERTLVAVGDDTTLNAGAKIQAHSQEDGTFKSDHITVGARCTLGIGSLVHYGVTMGDGAVLAPDSFLMKGEQVPAGAHWGGNPATEWHTAVERTPAAGGRTR